MVVVLIIGILVSIAVPVFEAASVQARAKSCQANQRTITGAIDTRRTENDDLSSATSGEFTAGGSGWYGLLVGSTSWIQSKPVCPAGNTNYYLDAAGNVTGDSGASATTIKAGHTIGSAS
jgi:type II secretory pathway pseudopilin PulG